jgi:Zn-dependent peptidase ImmA (M78 family)
MQRRNEPAGAAIAQRAAFGVGDSGPIDSLRLIEDEAGAAVILAAVANGPHGMYTHAGELAILMVNTSLALVRQRFTLAHEYGHHVLGHDPVVDVTIDARSGDPREVQANQFAAEFLMPRSGVEIWMSNHDYPEVDLEVVVRIASHFGVSAYVALFRLQDARRVRAEGALRIRQLIDAGDHKVLEAALVLPPYADGLAVHAQSDAEVRVPLILQRHALDAYAAGLVDIDAVAKALRITSEAAQGIVDAAGLQPPAELDEMTGGLFGS